MIKQFSNLEKLFIILTIAAGSLILFFPIQYLLIGFFAFVAFAYLMLNPKVCFYLVVFTVPFIGRIRILPISFSVNDILIVVCLLATALNILLKNHKVQMRTKLDLWNILLVILFFFAGLTSEGPTGPLSSFKFLEAIVVFYLTVYYVRTKEVTIARVLKVVIASVLFQALYGCFQSLTGIGATFRSARGIWGYLGIGSNMVWHGMGSMGHFNMLGNYLVTMLLFFLPVCRNLIKNPVAKKSILLIAFVGIITTYSRGSLIALYFGGFYFLFMTVQNRVKLTSIFSFSLVVLAVVKNFLSKTSYGDTLSPRNDIWDGVIASILSNPKFTWVGAGLNSYEQVVYAYLPQNNTLWFAHNLFLLTIQEMGIIGFILFFSFIIFILVDTYKKASVGPRLLRTLNLSVSLCIFAIFFVSIFDHAYSLPSFKILLFMLLGIIYAKDKKLHSSNI